MVIDIQGGEPLTDSPENSGVRSVDFGHFDEKNKTRMTIFVALFLFFGCFHQTKSAACVLLTNVSIQSTVVISLMDVW